MITMDVKVCINVICGENVRCSSYESWTLGDAYTRFVTFAGHSDWCKDIITGWYISTGREIILNQVKITADSGIFQVHKIMKCVIGRRCGLTSKEHLWGYYILPLNHTKLVNSR